MSSGTNEKFCLRWNEFESNISRAFRELKDDKDFFDVTIACEDNQIQAHKVILSACSPFFRSVLKRNPHQHPLLYLKGVRYNNMLAVLNFMYHGEVNVAQEELNPFLAVAEDLQVKGLTQNDKKDTENIHHHQDPIPPPVVHPPQNNSKKFNKPVDHEQPVNKVSKVRQQQVVEYGKEVNVKTETPYLVEVAEEEVPEEVEFQQQQQYEYQEGFEEHQDTQYAAQNNGNNSNSTGDAAVDFDDYVTQNSVKLSESRQIQCLLCNKLTAHVGNMKQHFEVYHYHRQYKCDICQNQFKTKNSLDFHRKNKGHYHDPSF